MKFKILPLLGWHLMLFFLFYELRVVLEEQSLAEFQSWLLLKDGLLNLSSLLVFFLYSLGAYFVLLYTYPHSYLGMVLGILGVSILTIAIRFLIEEVFFLRVFGFDNFYEMPFWKYGLRNFFYAILHLSLGIVFFFVQYSAYQKEQAQQLTIEHKQTELAYLRSQVNPHFLFNTLNNIYSLVYRGSEQALPALEQLTSMLRYSLYEGDEWVPLSKEIEHIQHFIQLAEIRFAYPLQLDIQLPADDHGWRVPPFILLPFIENALKHGDPKKPISLQCTVQPDQLECWVQNTIAKNKQKDAVGGIGLNNIRKRLELIYGPQHRLDLQERDDDFMVYLVIQHPDYA